MAGSLKIAYRRKRNVGGRVVRNFVKRFNGYFGGHVSREDVTCVLALLRRSGNRLFGSAWM